MRTETTERPGGHQEGTVVSIREGALESAPQYALLNQRAFSASGSSAPDPLAKASSPG